MLDHATRSSQRDEFASAGEMGGIEILQIEDLGASEAGIRYSVDNPKPGRHPEPYAFLLRGWVLAADEMVEGLDVTYLDRVVRTTSCWVPRQDVAAAFPHYSEAARSGFHTLVTCTGLPAEFEIGLAAVLAGGRRVPMCRIRARHAPVDPGFRPALAPLILTSVFRTGTTWLMRLLSEHPAIVAHRAYPYETRIAAYWLHMLKVVSLPTCRFEKPGDIVFDGHRYVPCPNPTYDVGFNPYTHDVAISQPELRAWLDNGFVTSLATAFQQRVDDTYRLIQQGNGQTSVHYFVEKIFEPELPWLFWKFYPQMREIVLVRDFRDVICSELAFFTRRRIGDFVSIVDNYEEWLKHEFRWYLEGLMEGWRQRGAQAHLVRYEDLVADPEREVAGVLRYLDLDASSSLVAEIVARAAVPTPELGEHRTSRDLHSSVGRWRRELKPEFQEATREFLGEALLEFGYAIE